MSDRVYINDLRDLGYCNKGIRKWLQRRDLSWSDLLRNGISFDTLRKSGDSMAIAAISCAEQRKKGDT